MPVSTTINHHKLREYRKLQEIYLRTSSWIRDMSAPRAPARLQQKNHGTRAAGGGPSK